MRDEVDLLVISLGSGTSGGTLAPLFTIGSGAGALLAPEAFTARTVGELIVHPPRTIYPDATLREAADRMVDHDIGRLPVIERGTNRLIGIITRSDLLSAHRKRLREVREAHRSFGGIVPASPDT